MTAQNVLCAWRLRSKKGLFAKHLGGTPAKRVLDQAGLGYLSPNVTHMLYPNDPSRVAGNRHYLNVNGTWTATGSTIDGTMLATGAISGGAGTHVITLPAACVSRVQVLWMSSWANVVAFEIGFNRALTSYEQSALVASSFIAQVIAGTGLSLVNCRAIYTGDGYYVDSVNGDDGNAGGITAPFATISAMLAADTVSAKSCHYLASGSTWREQYDQPRNGQTLFGYGRGIVPKIIGSNVVAEAWSKTGGQTNVYQITVSGMLDTSGYVSVWEGTTRLSLASDLAGCDATQGTYWVSTHDGPTTIYVHATDSSNPSTNGRIYEYTGKREYGFYCGASISARVDGVWMTRNYCNNGSAWFKQDSTITWCRFSEGTKHNCLSQYGCVFEDCLYDEAYYTVAGTGLMTWNIAEGDGVRGMTLRRCTCSMSTVSAAVGGFSGHLGAPGAEPIEFVTFEDCATIKCYGEAYPAGGTKVLNITRSTSDGCVAICAPVEDLENVNILGGTFTINQAEIGNRCAIQPVANCTQWNVSIVSATVKWGAAMYTLIKFPNAAGRTVTITDCVFIPTGTAGRGDCSLILGPVVLGTAGQRVTITFERNSIDSSNVIFTNYVDDATMVFDYNQYTSPMHYQPAAWQGTNKTFAEWQALGFDVHSTVV